MNITLKRGLALSAIAGLAVTGCAARSAAASMTVIHPHQTIDLSIHLTNLDFVSASGVSSPYPTGALSTGDRVIGRDDVLQGGSVIGSDHEFCTVGFELHVLCDDMVDVTNAGQMHITWMFQWPASGTPQAWTGVIDGGTGAYQDAAGTFKARALPGGNTAITVQLEEK